MHHFLRPLRWAGLSLLLITWVAAVVMANPPGADRISLAGTFNNWATNDEAYRLREVNGRWELVRFWPGGSYEFKFVFNGSWDRHLGDAGGDKLAQPGSNVPLRIPQSGEYALWLDLQAARWGLEPRPATRVHAVIRLFDRHTGRVVLDATASLHRPDQPLKTYRWEVLAGPKGTGEEPGCRLEAADRRQAILEVLRPGTYQLQLTVSDGEMSDRATVAAELAPGWELLVAASEEALSSAKGEAMLPLDGERYAAVIRGRPGEERTLAVRPTGSPSARGPATATAQVRLSLPAEKSLVVFDAPRASLSLRSGGWHEFVYVPEEDVRLPKGTAVDRVHLAGTFNEWSADHTPLFATEGGKRFRRILLLPDAVHHYKFVVNGQHWLEDAHADPRLRESDEQGGFNSGLLIGDDARELGPPKPDHVVGRALRHDPGLEAYFQPVGQEAAKIVVRTLADDATAVFFCPVDDRGQVSGKGRVSLRRSEPRHGFEFWTAQIMAEKPGLRYVFEVQDGEYEVFLGAEGVGGEEEAARRPFEGHCRMSFETPEWAKHAVWYQIFPERFRNGEPANDPPRTVPWRHEWFKPYRGTSGPTSRSDAEKTDAARGGAFVEEGTFYQFIYDRRYGGDIQGIQEKLPYLRQLGVTALYLNPVFLAESLHKYDASDYRHIDDFFGVKDSLKQITGETEDPATWQWSATDKLFLAFLEEAHRQGFKVIIDGVFNHTGREFWAFQDILKNKEKSPYVDWFDIVSFEPFHYKGWDRDDGALPRLKHDDRLGLSEPVRRHLFAVTRRWMDPNGDGDPSDGIDGWRLDVASDINEHFWRDWRKLVKSINPDAYIVAELWEKSVEWLRGDTFDAVMNYPVARACQRFFVNDKKAITPAEFGRQLSEVLGWYPPQVNYVQQNLLDSHDTDRVASMFMNPDLEYDKANRLQDNGPNYNPNKPTPECYHRLKAMVTAQMMFLGAPMVYYGGEVGMYGADDPSCRKPMLWPDLLPYDDPEERIEQDVFEHYRRMIAIRNTLPAVRLGAFEVLQAEARRGLFAFARTLGEEVVVVVVSNSDRGRRVDLPVSWPEGTRVLRLDDPTACRVVDPPPADLKARPTIRPIEGHQSPWIVKGGRLQGGTIPARGSAVFAVLK